MSKIKIYTAFDDGHLNFEGVVNKEASQTQPEDVLTIGEVLQRYQSGGVVTGTNKEPMFYDEELGYVPKIDELDLVEREEYAERMYQMYEAQQAEIKKLKDEADEQLRIKQEEEQAFRQQVQDWHKSQSEQQ